MLKGKEQLIGSIVTIFIVIWGLIETLLSLGMFIPKTETVDALTSYLNFYGKVLLCIIPVVIGSLALIPLYNEDDEIISIVSYVLAVICLIIITFTKSSFNKFFMNLIICDLLILLVYIVKTSSMGHRIFKIIVCLIAVIDVFLSNAINESNSIDDISLSSGASSFLYGTSSRESDEVLRKVDTTLSMIFLIGILLNPGVAMILNDGTGYRGSGDKRPSPVELYNRLVKKNQEEQAAQAAQAALGTPAIPIPGAPVPGAPVPGAPANPAPAAPAAPPEPTPAPNPPVQTPPEMLSNPSIGPNSGAIINPIQPQTTPAKEPAPVEPTEAPNASEMPALATPVAPAAPATPVTPATPTTPPAVPRSLAEQANINFEVPQSMAFLFDENNSNQGNSNN